MRLGAMMCTLSLCCCSLLLIGCGGAKPSVIVHDSNIPIPVIYDQQGQVIPGYQGYSDGFVSNTMKECLSFLRDEEPGVQEPYGQ